MRKGKTYDMRDSKVFEEPSSRSVVIYYDSKTETIEKDNKVYQVTIPVGHRRVVNVSNECRLHDHEIAWNYYGFILKDEDLVPRLLYDVKSNNKSTDKKRRKSTKSN